MSSIIESYLTSVPMLVDSIVEDGFTLKHCTTIDNVCYGREDHIIDFIFMYACLFTNSHVQIPSCEFTMGVLRTLNVMLTQLHPNSWTSLQAFQLLPEMLHLNPSPHVYIHFYSFCPSQSVRWLSLII